MAPKTSQMSPADAETYKEIGIRIGIARVARKLSQEAVANLLGVSRPVMSYIEAGDTYLDITRLYAIAEILRVSPYDLLPPSSSHPKAKYAYIARKWCGCIVGIHDDLPTINRKEMARWVSLYIENGYAVDRIPTCFARLSSCDHPEDPPPPQIYITVDNFKES